MDRPPVPGILIEGHEYSGKTTLARGVADALRHRGLTVRAAHGTLTRDPFVRSLLDEALAVFAGAEHHGFRHPATWRRFNSLRSAQLMLDTELFRQREPAPGEILVQDRYWLPQYAFNQYFTPAEGYLGETWIASRVPRFAVQVHLTCDTATRRRRAAARDGDGAKHPLNAFLRRHLDELAGLDRFTTGLVQDSPHWLVLRSDRLSPEELVDAVLRRFDAHAILCPAQPVAAGADRWSTG
ncbi:hypothetical protein [Streptomyces gilvifuscus]|uniref:Thymidylate kinase n=1 Tax=Streptomyces gilvifuscus TaxID=1550617 RepID=A0ABT5G8B9_9ACTN|nr:hypothetical protein [Streptomyces gilvifuscus]MDC2961118.1 hypothetical protein [Streptomyces gilvifuscus]